MKKITILLLFLCTIMLAQEKKKNYSLDVDRKSELKLNVAYLLTGAFDIYYERVINEESAFGASILIAYENDNGIGDQYKYMISPYYRFYFGKKYAAGFFAEGFGSLNSSRELYFFGNSEEFVTDFALGIGIGGKWITKRGIVFEIYSSFGRNLFSNDNNNGLEFISRGGISIGYRF